VDPTAIYASIFLGAHVAISKRVCRTCRYRFI
jgi:hypothetical protein